MSKEKLGLTSYGGQALIEGVLMRGSYGVSAAFRAPNGEIILQSEPLSGIYKSNIKKWPFLRGLILLWDALGLGMRYLTISANLQTGENEKIEGPTLYITLGVALLFGVLIFFVGPAALGGWIGDTLKWNTWWTNLLEGIIRLFIIIGYIWGVGFMQDIRTVFAYHGAEHKTINAYEAGDNLTPENVSKYSLEHPRCGTSFLLTLVLLSIIVFTALGPLPMFWRLASRILFIPILAGVAYEYIKWMSNHLDSPVIRWLIRPNMALQKLTTREPNKKQLEISIAAFNKMMEQENTLRPDPEKQPVII
jgi:uncharacterized protein YqhQ